MIDPSIAHGQSLPCRFAEGGAKKLVTLSKRIKSRTPRPLVVRGHCCFFLRLAVPCFERVSITTLTFCPRSGIHTSLSLSLPVKQQGIAPSTTAASAFEANTTDCVFCGNFHDSRGGCATMYTLATTYNAATIIPKYFIIIPKRCDFLFNHARTLRSLHPNLQHPRFPPDSRKHQPYGSKNR